MLTSIASAQTYCISCDFILLAWGRVRNALHLWERGWGLHVWGMGDCLITLSVPKANLTKPRKLLNS